MYAFFPGSLGIRDFSYGLVLTHFSPHKHGAKNLEEIRVFLVLLNGLVLNSKKQFEKCIVLLTIILILTDMDLQLLQRKLLVSFQLPFFPPPISMGLQFFEIDEEGLD